MKRRIIGVFAAACLALTLMQAPALAADYSDMPQEESWSYAALTAAVENGLLQGNDGFLRPEASLSRAEMAAILVRAFGAQTETVMSFTDVPSGAWYASDVAKAVQMGAFQGTGSLMRPNEPISRQEAFTVLARVLCLEDGDVSVLTAFSDGDQVAAWAAPSLSALISGGYIQGSGGALNPQANIKRSEFAKVMYDLVRSYVTEAGVYTSLPAGNVGVRTSGVTLQGLTVEGDLIVGDSVGSGGVTLDGVTVTGRILIRSGSEASVSMVGGSTAGSVVVRSAADEGGSTGESGTAVEGETVTVTTAEEFTAALADPSCAAITVSGGIDIDGGSYTISKPVTVGGLDNYLAFINAQVVNESTITVLPHEVTDPAANDSGFYVVYGETQEGSNFYNSGTLDIQEGTVTIQGATVENTGTIRNAGELYLFGDNEVVNRGTITNQGGIYFIFFNTPDGTIGGGDVINTEGATITSSGYFRVDLANDRTFTNAGTVTNSGEMMDIMCPVFNSGTIRVEEALCINSSIDSDGNFRAASLDNTGTITIAGQGAALDIGVDVYYQEGEDWVHYTAPGEMTNSGTIQITGQGARLSTQGEGSRITNTGTITLTGQDASLEVGSDYYYREEGVGDWIHYTGPAEMTNSGTIQVSGQGVRLMVQGEGSRITNTGAVEVTGPGEIFARANGTLDNQGEVTVSGGDANFNIGMSWYDEERETQMNDVGVVINSGAITVADSAWLCVQVEGSILTNEAGGTIAADSVGMAVAVNGTLDNAGTIILANAAGLDVGAAWEDGYTHEQLPAAGTMTNSGTVTIGAGSGLGVHYEGSSLTNSGTITVQIDGGFGVDEGAVFEGNEVIDGNLPEAQEGQGV